MAQQGYKDMKIGVIGCGYVGFSTLKGFVSHGINAIGYDTNTAVLDKISDSLSPSHCTDAIEDLLDRELIFECVPTDPKPGTLECDISIVEQVVAQIAELEKSQKYRCDVFVQRSTCPPGTANALSAKFKKTNYAVNPSFLTKSAEAKGSTTPTRIVIGGNDYARQELKKAYEKFNYTSIMESTCLKSIELMKYIENCTDAVLISLWNEYLSIADSIGIQRENFFEIMTQIPQREKFSTVLRVPSRAYSLWCLPKDISALSFQAAKNHVETHVLDGAIKTNKLFEQKNGANTIPSDQLLEWKNSMLVPTKIARELVTRRK